MPARIQDVEQMDCHGKFGFGFGVWDEDGKLALNIGFATSEEANQAGEQFKAIIPRALLVAGPG